MDNDIAAPLTEFICKTILKQPQKIIPENEPLLTSGVIDSFSLVDLAIFIEETFGVRIEDTELNPDTFDTLEQLVSLIQKRKGSG